MTPRQPLSERWLYPDSSPDNSLPMALRWLRAVAQAAASPLWEAFSAARRQHSRPHRPRPLCAAQCPVISVGALTVGGAGKTEVVAHLARALAARKIENILVVSRGYGRASAEIRLVSPDAAWREVGDEPLMLASALPFARLVVGADRGKAIDFAWRAAGPFGAILLDDGFQHLRLSRDLDVVLVPPNVEDLSVFPAGPLREPLSALSSLSFPAGLLWVHAGDGAPVSASHAIAGRAPDVMSRYAFAGLSGPPDEKPSRCALVTAVGRNQNVARLLASNHIEVVHHVALRDHDPLTDAAQRLRAIPPHLPILTTHKDWPKLASALNPHPSLKARVRRVNIAVEILHGGAALEVALSAALAPIKAR